MVIEPIKPVRPVFDQGRLASTIYDDHYFGASDAIDESRYLYVLGNQLPERFAECSAFGVGELGFSSAIWPHNSVYFSSFNLKIYTF